MSNKSVLHQAGATAMSEQILRRQLVLMGKVARSAEESVLRCDVFVGSTLNTQVGRSVIICLLAVTTCCAHFVLR